MAKSGIKFGLLYQLPHCPLIWHKSNEGAEALNCSVFNRRTTDVVGYDHRSKLKSWIPPHPALSLKGEGEPEPVAFAGSREGFARLGQALG